MDRVRQLAILLIVFGVTGLARWVSPSAPREDACNNSMLLHEIEVCDRIWSLHMEMIEFMTDQDMDYRGIVADRAACRNDLADAEQSLAACLHNLPTGENADDDRAP